MPLRRPCLLATLLLAASACGRVVLDDDGSVEASSASGGVTAGGGDLVSVGAGPEPTAGSGDGVGGGAGAGVPDGGAGPGEGGRSPGAGGAESGEGGAPPVESCTALSWASPPLVHGPYEDETLDAVLLRQASAGRAAVSWLKSGAEVRVLNRVASFAWEGDVTWSHFGHGGFNRPLPGAEPGATLLATGATGNIAYLVPQRAGGATLHEHVDDLAVLPEAMGPLHGFTGLDGGFVVLHGAAERLERSIVASDGGITGDGVVACGDRPLAVRAVRTWAGRALVAQATAPGGCDAPAGAPTVVRVDVVGGDGVTGTSVDLEAPVADVHVAEAPDGAVFLAVRTEGAAALRTFHVDLAAGATPLAEVPLAVGRHLAIAARGPDLVVVDTGPATPEDPALRVRVLDPGGVVVAAAGAPPETADLTFERAPALLVAPDGGALLVAAIARDVDGLQSLRVQRAACVAGP